jgi:hypothetical protein
MPRMGLSHLSILHEFLLEIFARPTIRQGDSVPQPAGLVPDPYVCALFADLRYAYRL